MLFPCEKHYDTGGVNRFASTHIKFKAFRNFRHSEPRLNLVDFIKNEEFDNFYLLIDIKLKATVITAYIISYLSLS